MESLDGEPVEMVAPTDAAELRGFGTDEVGKLVDKYVISLSK